MRRFTSANAARVGNKIDTRSFVHEYTDDYYTNVNREEYNQLYTIKDASLWKGSATRKGTEHFIVKNEKSRV